MKNSMDPVIQNSLYKAKECQTRKPGFLVDDDDDEGGCMSLVRYNYSSE